jgi:hypothetical protein
MTKKGGGEGKRKRTQRKDLDDKKEEEGVRKKMKK